MRIGDFVYFAPGLLFTELDLDGPRLSSQFEKRINSYFLEPADECCEREHPFAAGLVLVSSIDAIARLQYPHEVKVRSRFKKFVEEELSSFADDQLARRFYEDFRNGLVHEARIKKGGQFSLSGGNTIHQENGLLIVNPRWLGKEVRNALTRYVTFLDADETVRRQLAVNLKHEFAEELTGTHSRR